MIRWLLTFFACDHAASIREIRGKQLWLVCPCGFETVAIQRASADHKKLKALRARLAKSKRELTPQPQAENVVPIEQGRKAQ